MAENETWSVDPFLPDTDPVDRLEAAVSRCERFATERGSIPRTDFLELADAYDAYRRACGQ